MCNLSCSFTILSEYGEETFEIAYRSGSFEVNKYSGKYFSKRVYVNGFVYVYSSVKQSDLDLYDKHYLKSIIKLDQNIYCEEFCSRDFRIGEKFDFDNGLELIKTISERIRSSGLDCETILVSRNISLKHNVEEYGVESSENRYIHELYVYTYTVFMGRVVTSSRIIVSNKLRDLFNEIEPVVNNILNNIKNNLRAKSFNPVNTGKWRVLLTGDSACAFYHEIAHLLEADEPVKLPINYNFNIDLKITEDPFYPGPLQRLFDDELYPAWRRTIVDDGVVIDYFRTRTSCNGSKPGNARGLFTKPKPFYHQLIVKPGDWSIDEVMKEFRKILLVEDIFKAELFNNYINIYPETAYVYENDKWIPVRNILVRIPVNQLNNLFISLTRDINIRYSFEKNNPLYETTPSTLLEAQVLV